jgi:hypothetical protein
LVGPASRRSSGRGDRRDAGPTSFLGEEGLDTISRIGNKTRHTRQWKLIRRTPATLLESHKEYGRLVDYFLGHAPADVARTNDAARSQPLLDESVCWLRGAYGFGGPDA